MARLPTVGAQALHIAQLPPRVRKILQHRAQAAARREYAPVLAADRGAFGAANQAYRREAASARGATNATESALMQALGHTSGLDIPGRYRQQLKNEFSSRAADTASALPLLLAGAQEERGDALQAAQQQFASDRASMLQSGAAKFNQTLKETRDQAASVVANRAEERKEAEQDPVTVPYAPTETGREAEKAAAESKKEVELALQEVKRLLTAYPEEHPHSKSEWAAFAGTVAKSEGVGTEAAIKAVEIIRQHAAKRSGN